MTNAVESERDTVTDHVAPLAEKSGESGFQNFLVGIVVLGLLGLVAYQLIGCAACYGASWIQ
jgi:hypothetical protein